MYIPGNNKTADCAAVNQTPITYSLGYRAICVFDFFFFLIHTQCCCALENLKDSYALQKKKSDGICRELVSMLFLVTHDGWQHSPCSHRRIVT